MGITTSQMLDILQRTLFLPPDIAATTSDELQRVQAWVEQSAPEDVRETLLAALRELSRTREAVLDLAGMADPDIIRKAVDIAGSTTEDEFDRVICGFRAMAMAAFLGIETADLLDRMGATADALERARGGAW